MREINLKTPDAVTTEVTLLQEWLHSVAILFCLSLTSKDYEISRE